MHKLMAQHIEPERRSRTAKLLGQLIVSRFEEVWDQPVLVCFLDPLEPIGLSVRFGFHDIENSAGTYTLRPKKPVAASRGNSQPRLFRLIVKMIDSTMVRAILYTTKARKAKANSLNEEYIVSRRVVGR